MKGSDYVEEIKSRYYTVQQIKKLEGCGKDKAYDIANKLPHEIRGKQIFVFAEDYDNYYQQKRQKALEEQGLIQKKKSNIYQIRKFS